MSERDHQAFNGQFDEALLTAYALGELEGAELALVEAALKASPDASRAVDEIRVLAGYIREAAGHDERFVPSATLREEIESRLDQSAPRPAAEPLDRRARTGPSRRRPWMILALASAAVLVLAVAIPSLPLFQRGAPTGVAIGLPPPDSSKSFEVAIAEEDTADEVLSAPVPGEPLSETLAGKATERSEKAAGQTIAGDPAASGPAAPKAAESPMESAAASADKYREGDVPETEAARMLKAPLAGQPADVAAEESPPAAARGREAAAAEPRRALSELKREASAVAAGESQDRLDAVLERKPQAKQEAATPAAKPAAEEAAKPAAVSLGLNELKRAPEQVKIVAEPQSAGRGRAMHRGVVAGPRKAFSASVPPPAAGPAGDKAGREARIVVADEAVVGGRPVRAVEAAPAGARTPGALAEDRGGGLGDGQVMGGGYGGFGGGGDDDRANEAKERAYSYSQVERLEAGRDAEQYASPEENAFQSPAVEPESTVSIDVDTASYANVRRLLQNNQVPPPGAVRIEEMVNYFSYDYPEPKRDHPFAVDMEAAGCPWNGNNRLVRVGLKAREVDAAQRGPSNLVFLLDVSGSMRDANKLPLVKDALAMLVDQLTEDDHVSIVTYAGQAGLALEPTEGTRRKQILERIEALQAGGSTHGSAGIQMAYDQALANFVPGGNNRVILCTDGDLNVGVTDDDELVGLIKEQASSGVFLTVVGFGTGNLKDAKLEKLADNGNGTYAYVDGLREARKVFVEQVSGRLVTVAQDVKIQIEFNPAEVAGYRLLGYENRLLAAEDFSDDLKDAGEMGAGDSVTFFYEIVPLRGERPELAGPAQRRADLRYQRVAGNELTAEAKSGELLTLKLRYKLPGEQQSRLLEFAVQDDGKSFGQASKEFRFAAAVASFGLVLRGSQYNRGLSLTAVEEFAAGAATDDPMGLRSEFVDLVRQARTLCGETPRAAAAPSAPD
ncbi:MAG: von Willebrand factor type A domain-containing protein [Planctomycetota bacterium]|nr:von Willebrand factor type A domain-containing protein [Planctomycetota bacterium]